MPLLPLDTIDALPEDIDEAFLVGRVWRDGSLPGPSVVLVRDSVVHDITAQVGTVADFLDCPDLLGFAKRVRGEVLGDVHDFIGQLSQSGVAETSPKLLAPCDVQAIKACGVTFAVSLLERVIEEQAGGDASKAKAIRGSLFDLIGADLSSVRPGSERASRLKTELMRRGAWSQYLEVGIGTDAEVFTKSQPMSAVGFGAQVGLHADSCWNNPEPEVVLAVNSRSEAVGATLGNDVNLRDIEGRSALLLGKAKDNNASCAVGPFVRIFDERFTMNTVRSAEVHLKIEGADDGFVLEGVSRMSEISRDPLELIAQTSGRHRQYPDGFMLFLGTMFAPIKDRDAPGAGFTHHIGDRVTISSPRLGALVNYVERCEQIAPWQFGVRALYANLAQRGIRADLYPREAH